MNIYGKPEDELIISKPLTNTLAFSFQYEWAMTNVVVNVNS